MRGRVGLGNERGHVYGDREVSKDRWMAVGDEDPKQQPTVRCRQKEGKLWGEDPNIEGI